MTALLVALHVVVCIALIIVVLLQAGKGAEIGASFGAGSSQTVFGAAGGKNFMSRMTTATAVIFMLTSLTLAYFYSQPGTSSVMPEEVAPKAAPANAPTAAPAPEAAPAAPEKAPADGQENQ